MKFFYKIYVFLYLLSLLLNKIYSIKLLDDNKSVKGDESGPLIGISLPRMSKCDEVNKARCKEICKDKDMCFCFQFEGKKDLRCACKTYNNTCPRF